MVSFVITFGCIIQRDRGYMTVNLDKELKLGFFAMRLHSTYSFASLSSKRVGQFYSDFVS